MKKIVLALSILTLALSSYGQISDVFRLGLSANPFVSYLSSNDVLIKPVGTNTGFHLGFDAELFFGSSDMASKNYAITTGFGILFNSGGALEHTNGGELWKSKELRPPLIDAQGTTIPFPDGTTLGYGIQMLRIPLGIKMRTNEIGYLRYYGQVPFYVDVATQGRGSVKNAGALDTEKQNINSDVNPLNLSWGIGGGAEYGISDGTSVVAGLFYHGGFLDITNNKGEQNNSPNNPNEDSKTVLSSISLKVGILF